MKAATWTPDTIPRELDIVPPPLAAFLAGQARGGTEGGLPPAGAACRAALFGLSPGWTYLNHGSYGGTFKLAMEARARGRLPRRRRGVAVQRGA